MNVRVGNLRFHAWQSLELLDGWSDTFVFRMQPTAGLPPGDYARVVRSLAAPLRRLRPTASLWVQVTGDPTPAAGQTAALRTDGDGKAVAADWEDGKWFQAEVRHALRGLLLPFAVTGGDQLPQFWDFSHTPRLDRSPFPQPPTAEPYLKEESLRASELTCLRVLARSDCAYTAEVASLSGLSRTRAWRTLGRLAERRLVSCETGGKYPTWKISRSGLSLTLRSWGLPPGLSFRGRKERGRDACMERAFGDLQGNTPAEPKEQITFTGKERVSFWARVRNSTSTGQRRGGSRRHRRTARLWLAWLRCAWPQAEVWAGWSEVSCGRLRPDALVWGRLDGHEVLIWLEVESGTCSIERLQQKTIHRINQALLYTRRSSLRLVFTLLGPPWVLFSAIRVLREIPADLAILLEDWKTFGSLPVPKWGSVRER